MPRPKQRAAGDVKRLQKQQQREEAEAEARAKLAAEKRARHRKSELAINSLPTASGSGSSYDGATLTSRPVDPDALPEPDPDTKAYFKQVSDKINEIEELGQGKRAGRRMDGGNGAEEEEEGDYQDEEQEDDRPLLLRSALESLNGHEIALAGDGETSIILERLLYAMDDFARRVLADRFTGHYPVLVKHRAASHVLQTLFTLSGQTVDRETRGIFPPTPPAASTSTLPLMSTILPTLLSEILSQLPSLIYDPFGSHTLRVLLLLFSGLTLSPSSKAERSKKSQNWRSRQGPMKSFLDDDQSNSRESAIAEGKKLETPESFKKALKEMKRSLDEGLDGVEDNDLVLKKACVGAGIRSAALHEVAGPAIRILVEVELVDKPFQHGGYVDRLLCGLCTRLSSESEEEEEEAVTELRSEYLGSLLRSPTSSPLFELILLKSPPKLFSTLWDTVFTGRIGRLSAGAVSNFVVATGIARLSKDQFGEVVKEIKAVPVERRAEWIDNRRTGVLKALIERARELGVAEADVSEILLDTFGLNDPADQNLVIPCVLTLNRLEWYRKTNPDAAQPETQGSILLQSWLKLSNPHQQAVITSLLSLPLPKLLDLCFSPTSSHVIDAFLTSPTTTPTFRRKFLVSLLGSYHTLADNRVGSRVAEKCFATSDVYLKDKIAQSLVGKEIEMQRSSFAHFFARKVELPFWSRRREDWKKKMGEMKLATSAPTIVVKPVVVEEEGKKEKKKRERKVDEVDEIFSRAGKKGKITATEVEVESVAVSRPAERKEIKGLDEVFGALKASVV